jgi:hypothetical protein
MAIRCCYRHLSECFSVREVDGTLYFMQAVLKVTYMRQGSRGGSLAAVSGGLIDRIAFATL